MPCAIRRRSLWLRANRTNARETCNSRFPYLAGSRSLIFETKMCRWESGTANGETAMSTAQVKHHDYHLVDPSPWPIVGSVSGFIMSVGAITGMHDLISVAP